MPNLLDTILASDAALAFCTGEDFSEPVVYVPKGVAHGTGTATVVGGAVTAIAVASAGSGYTIAPPVLLTGGGGRGARATAVITNGAITGFTVTAGGTGYTTAPTVVVGGVYAVVKRDPPAEVNTSAGGDVRRVKMEVEFPNSATLGVATIDTGGDRIEVADRVGGTVRSLSVGVPISQDYGVWKVPLK